MTDRSDAGALEAAIGAIEQQLDALGAAMRAHDASAIDTHALGLQHALVAAVQRVAQAARQPGGVPPALRRRLAQASGQVAAQRESLARATAALDRAIDVLMPGAPRPAAYAAQGVMARAPRAEFIGA